MTLFQVSIACLPTIPIEQLALEDQHDKPWCVRVYKVFAASEQDAEERGLDRFHSEVPISCVDDFGIYAVPVQSTKTMKGN